MVHKNVKSSKSDKCIVRKVASPVRFTAYPSLDQDVARRCCISCDEVFALVGAAMNKLELSWPMCNTSIALHLPKCDQLDLKDMSVGGFTRCVLIELVATKKWGWGCELEPPEPSELEQETINGQFSRAGAV